MSSRIIRSCILYAAAIFLTFAPLAWAFANPDGVDDIPVNKEYQNKAGVICNIARFVDWPKRKFSEADAPLVIGIVGSDPISSFLDEDVQDKRLADRTVIVKKIESMEEMRKCHILFISRSEAGRLGAILANVRSDNVLTISDIDKFLTHGGMINLINVGNAVKFQLNDSAAKHADIKLHAQLYTVAMPVTK